MLNSDGMARFSSSPIPLSLGFMLPLSLGFILGLAASNQNNSEGTGVMGGGGHKSQQGCPLKVLVSKLGGGGEKCQVSPRVTGDAVSFVVVVSLFLSL